MKLQHVAQLTLFFSLGFLQVTAQPQGPGGPGFPREGLVGTVTAIGKDSLTVTPVSGGDPVTVKVSDSTRVMKERQPATLKEIKAGDIVVARGSRNGNSVDAQMLGVVPPEMAERIKQGGGRGIFTAGPGPGAFSPEEMGKKFIAGEVKAINETHLMIARPDGQNQDIEVDENTSFRRGSESITLADIKVGDFVRGPGELKNNVFTPKELRVGRPRIQMRLVDPAGGENTAPPNPAEHKPSPQTPPE